LGVKIPFEFCLYRYGRNKNNASERTMESYEGVYPKIMGHRYNKEGVNK